MLSGSHGDDEKKGKGFAVGEVDIVGKSGTMCESHNVRNTFSCHISNLPNEPNSCCSQAITHPPFGNRQFFSESLLFQETSKIIDVSTGAEN